MISKGDLERCCSSVMKGSDATASVQLTGWERLRATSVLSEFVEENFKCAQIRGGKGNTSLTAPPVAFRLWSSLSKLRVLFTGECAGGKKTNFTNPRDRGRKNSPNRMKPLSRTKLTYLMYTVSRIQALLVQTNLQDCFEDHLLLRLYSKAL